MGDPTVCGMCGYEFCDCYDPSEPSDPSENNCERCGGCMGLCAMDEEEEPMSDSMENYGYESGMSLGKELQLYGCSMDPGDFKDLLAELHHNMHPAWSPEQLMYRPTCGIVFVNAVRSRTGCQGLPEEMVIRRLRNIQKHKD